MAHQPSAARTSDPPKAQACRLQIIAMTARPARNTRKTAREPIDQAAAAIVSARQTLTKRQDKGITTLRRAMNNRIPDEVKYSCRRQARPQDLRHGRGGSVQSAASPPSPASAMQWNPRQIADMRKSEVCSVPAAWRSHRNEPVACHLCRWRDRASSEGLGVLPHIACMVPGMQSNRCGGG